MVYGVCLRCGHTREITGLHLEFYRVWLMRCFSCGCNRWFRVVRQIEQPDGSVIEVSA